MVGLKIICCPLCGHPMRRTAEDSPGAEYTKREGFSISLAHYPRGFGGNGEGYAERHRFCAEVCQRCAADLAALLHALITFIQERDIDR